MTRPVEVRVLPGAVVYHGQGDDGEPLAHVAGQVIACTAPEAKTLVHQGVAERV